jgi:hypothetical protein
MPCSAAVTAGQVSIYSGNIKNDDRVMAGLRAGLSALDRIRSFVTVCDFSALATCYAELTGRVRPGADLEHGGPVHEMPRPALQERIVKISYILNKNDV